VARIEDGDNYVRLMVDNEVVYERVRHSTAVTTGASIRGWTAYDGNALYGLDPNREYWLDSRPWPANQIHLLQVDSSVVLSSSSFATRDYAYFGLERVPPESFDFTQAFSGARLGTIYNGTEYPLGFGAFAMQTRSLIGGDLKTPVVLMQPPSRLSGAVIYIEFHVPIAGPEFPDPILTFAAGMSDFATRTDGALFVVRVNGTEVWRTEITSRGLVPAEIDLSRWAGQTVRIRFIVHPGMRLNAGSDLACWTDLQIKFRSQRGATRFRIALPADASDVSSPVPRPRRVRAGTSEWLAASSPRSSRSSRARCRWWGQVRASSIAALPSGAPATMDRRSCRGTKRAGRSVASRRAARSSVLSQRYRPTMARP
jgi:hypothetical protein